VSSVLYITNVPTPYRLPLYRKLGELLRARGDRLHIFFLGYAKSERQWKIAEEDMRGIEYRANTAGDERARSQAPAAIDELRPAAVILAWAMDDVALRLLLHCRRRDVPCIIVSGETRRSAAHNPYALLREAYRIPFFKLAAGFVTYGRASTGYLLKAGVGLDKITTGINAVDTEFFAAACDSARSNGAASEQRRRFRDREGRGFTLHLLFVGYLLEEKGARYLIEMMADRSLRDCALHIVGAGPEEDALRRHAAECGEGDRIFFHGYRQQWELPLYYAMADILLFPSTLEVFGLVMLEAMAAGLPVIASKFAGGAIDLVEHGANGFLVDPRDAREMASQVAVLARDADLRRRMGLESRRRALELFTMERSAECFATAIERATDRAK
jgi:glycosyltransferase involved in cell wall biosynthesis